MSRVVHIPTSPARLRCARRLQSPPTTRPIPIFQHSTVALPLLALSSSTLGLSSPSPSPSPPLLHTPSSPHRRPGSHALSPNILSSNPNHRMERRTRTPYPPRALPQMHVHRKRERGGAGADVHGRGRAAGEVEPVEDAGPADNVSSQEFERKIESGENIQ
ncbi:hypothetical protein C8R45DRAFT_1091587 [Mycena sanguinolenta]|nr:hypothetical protein C8R45DRAFT_1091587 [Mycena sanguinolenta]